MELDEMDWICIGFTKEHSKCCTIQMVCLGLLSVGEMNTMRGTTSEGKHLSSSHSFESRSITEGSSVGTWSRNHKGMKLTGLLSD